MNLGPKGEALIKRFEKLRLVAYQDEGGIWTIGWGHTPAAQGQTCTQDEAQAWFVLDTQDAVEAVNRTVLVPVAQEQFDALVSFTYNVGIGSEAHSSLCRYLNAGNYVCAADEFLKWDKVNGQVSAGLTERRIAERALFLGLS